MSTTFEVLGWLVLVFGGGAGLLMLVADQSLASWSAAIGAVVSGLLFLGIAKGLELLEAINTNIRVTNSYLKAEDNRGEQ